MKSMFPKISFVGVSLSLLVLVFAFAGSALAQSKKSTAAKKPVAKKTERQAKDAKKDRDKAKLAAQKTKESKDKKKNEKQTASKNQKDKSNSADGKKNDKKSKAERNRLAAELRRKEAERRAAIVAEQRRREQARREAIARAIAFQRGLRTETVANISKDVTEGEDLNIRAAAVNALGDHAGSVVVMEAQTGKILTIVNQDWALRSGIKPCSTIKLVTGVAGLNEKAIDKTDGSLTTSTNRLGLDVALARSDNGYFQRAGSAMGNTKVIEYAKQLGLGEPTGFATAGEYSGKLPYNNSNARIYSHGDDFEVTTLQLAVMVSAITNGGHRVLPRVPRTEIEKTKFQTFYKANVEVPRESVRRVIPGMMGAAEYGTARRGMDQSLGVAGKTGSCISKGTWVGLFASVAPIEQPKYSVVVITRGAKERGRAAAAIAAQIYRTLAPNIVRTDRNLAQTEFKLSPRNSPILTTAAAVGEEDDDDAASTEGAELANIDANGREIIVVPSAGLQPQPAKKLVTKTGSSKPIFPPVVITYDKEGKELKPGSKKPE